VCVTTATIRIHPHTKKKCSERNKRTRRRKKNGDIRRKEERERERRGKTNKAVSSGSVVDMERTRKCWDVFSVLTR
jgi:hypothetical protein